MNTEDEPNTASEMTDAEKASAEGYPNVKAYRKAIREQSTQQAKVVDTLVLDGSYVRKRPRPILARLFCWLFFGLPLLVTTFYLIEFAADRYVAESKIFVTHVAPVETAEANIGNVLTGGSSRAAEDLPYLKEYILSLDMLLKLDQNLNLRESFAAPSQDFWYRLPEDATQELFLDYYRSRVNVTIDSNASILTVITEAFTPEETLKLNEIIIAECDKFINRLSQKSVDEHLIFAKKAVKHSRTELKAARIVLLTLQNRYGPLDPAVGADNESEVIAELGAKRVQLQVAIGRSKLAGTSDQKMSKVIVQYLDAKAQVDLSADMYRLALTALEGARAEGIRKLKSIGVIVKPKLPEEPGQPQKLMILGTLLLVLLLFYGFVKLVWAVIEDHREDA